MPKEQVWGDRTLIKYGSTPPSFQMALS